MIATKPKSNANMLGKDYSQGNSRTLYDNDNDKIISTRPLLIPINSIELSMSESNFEKAILQSTEPIQSEETEEVTALGQRGTWINKSEVTNWNGQINNYRLNETEPEVIYKKNNSTIEYTQEVKVKYLKPPTPPPPGDLIIRSEATNLKSMPPAPPQVIRQIQPRAVTPEPLIIREEPPELPTPIPRKVVRIVNNSTGLPLRRVIIEKMPQLPAKPQSVIIERWLPYSQQKRRVIFEKEVESRKAEKNLIIQWDQPKINYKTSVNWVGVENADPIAYKKKYGNNLTAKSKLPDYVKELDKESGFEEYCNEILKNNQELEGDIEALKYVDLDKEGLSKYKKYVDKRKDLLLTTSL